MKYSFHGEIQRAYSVAHSWLTGLENAKGYECLYPPNIKSKCLIDVAAQFSCFFPTHYFKTAYAFTKLIGRETLLDWLQLCTTVAIVDLGCGGGAATAATVAQLIELHDAGELNQNFDIFCIGVDPTPNALGIYYKMMNSLKACLLERSINLEILIIYKSIAEGISEVDDNLRVILKRCVQPAFSNVIILQSNVVDPLKVEHARQLTAQKHLRDLQVPCEVFMQESDFGSREAHVYHQLFRHVPIDRQLMVTVGTDCEDIRKLVFSMGTSLTHEFSRYQPERMADEVLYRVDYLNPSGSYWKECAKKNSYFSKFYTDIIAVKNTENEGDIDWHRVIAVENLELAWARARALLQREVLYDEIEIRLFERNLKANLKRLRQELMSYDIAVARTSDRIHFRFVKNEVDEQGRPRVLSRIEEEIVSIAIVQELGAAAFGLNATSYAYRPNPRFASRSEFLYDYWFRAYQRYKADIQNTVSKFQNSMILSIDLKSYFTGIPQQRLIDTVEKEVRTQSARVSWLLQRLLAETLHGHKEGKGLTQGGAGSGFYANAYLTAFDSRFGVNNRWEANVFRFVDDIVIVLPDSSFLNDAENVAKSTLCELGLSVNEEKSEPYSREEYLNLPQDGGKMDCLSERFKCLTRPLWRTTNDIIEQLRQEEKWWNLIAAYRDHLHSIGHYMEPHRLSRKLNQYVEKYTPDQDEDNDKKYELKMRPLDDPNWVNLFRTANDNWFKEREGLRIDLIRLAENSYKEYLAEECEKKKRLLSTRVYFSANRLASLGFGDSAEFFTEILEDKPWIIRQPQYVIRGLAIQGYSDHIGRLFARYQELDNPWSDSFLAVIIRAIRLLDKVPESLENSIIRIALDDESELILRLLATETWLMKLDCKHVVQHWSRIQEISDQELCARVRKNYLLLLAKCVRENVQQREFEDPLLTSAMEVAFTENVEDLFDYVEPDILRERFYSPSYPDFIDFDDDAPY